jgi:hypothetical protein
MNLSIEEIEDLIIADLTGSIRKDEKEQLEMLMSLYTDVRDRHTAISKRLTVEHIQEISGNRPPTNSLIAKIRRRKHVILIKKVLIHAVCIIVISVLAYAYWLSRNQINRTKIPIRNKMQTVNFK